MNQGTHLVGFALIATFMLGGCGEPATTTEGAAQSGALPGMPNSAENAEHIARGTLNSIDRAAGTANISHEPVASAGWPAMTMNFRLTEPDAAAQLTPGQRIEFRFTTEGGGTVTTIEPVH